MSAFTYLYYVVTLIKIILFKITYKLLFIQEEMFNEQADVWNKKIKDNSEDVIWGTSCSTSQYPGKFDLEKCLVQHYYIILI